MVKILRVKAKRDKTNGVTRYTYPAQYDAKKINVLQYESMSDDGLDDIKARGMKDGYLIGVVSDEDAPEFLKSRDIVEIDFETAVTLGTRWRKIVDTITDPSRVINILAKKARGIDLEEVDVNAIDPLKPELGINRRMSFREKLKRYV